MLYILGVAVINFLVALLGGRRPAEVCLALSTASSSCVIGLRILVRLQPVAKGDSQISTQEVQVHTTPWSTSEGALLFSPCQQQLAAGCTLLCPHQQLAWAERSLFSHG